MFTGIITAVGTVRGVMRSRGSIGLLIEKPMGWRMKPGESVSVDGICSTVKRLTRNSFAVDYMPETIKKTTARLFAIGAKVNLERSLRLHARLDGHFVQGHIDTTGTVLEAKRIGNSVVLRIRFPRRIGKFIAQKGSISVNGVSLTVVAAGRNWFSVSLIPYTLRHTNLQYLARGDRVNLEVDMLARYLDRLTS